MDSPRSDRASRRRSEGGRSSSRRRTADCEDEPSSSNSGRPPPSRRGSGIAAPIVTVRASANRTPTTAESTTPTLRIPPEEAQAQIITLESQIERLQLRLLENRLLESRESARANRMRVELETLPPPPLFDRSPMTPLVRTPNNGLRTPNNGPASPRTPGGVRLSQNTAGGANGSGHDGEDMRRNIRQRLGDLVRDLPSEQNSPVPYFPSPIIGLRETVRPRSMALGSETTARPSGWPRRRSVAETPSEPPWAELATRASRGLWRLEDGQDIDSELESLHESAARRHLYAANRSLATATREAERSRIMGNRTPSREDPPLILSPMDAEAEERLRAVWDDHDGDDYASSQISSLFQRPWAPREARHYSVVRTNTRAQVASATAAAAASAAAVASAVAAAGPPPETPAPDRTPAELIQPESAAHMQLQQLQLDIFRDALVGDPRSRHAERLRLRRRDSQRESQQHFHQPPASLDTQKGRPVPLEEADMKLDSECKICFGQIADTVLLPCAHLVVCQWCADLIGARTKDHFVRPMPHVVCPMCRTQVVDRIKVFRG